MAHQTDNAGVSRRAALRAIATGVGATASALWVGDLMAVAEAHAVQAHLLAVPPQGAAAWSPAVLTAQQLGTVGTIAELIIPATETPGARAALVDRFIDGVLAAATPDVRNRFLAGLSWLDTRSRALFQVPFDAATTTQQTDLLTRVSAESSTEDPAGAQFFTAIKSMTITGYYSTEIGLRQELGDDGVLMLPVYVGCTHPEHM